MLKRNFLIITESKTLITSIVNRLQLNYPPTITRCNILIIFLSSDIQQRWTLHWNFRERLARKLYFKSNFGYSIVIKGIYKPFSTLQFKRNIFIFSYLQNSNKILFQSYVWSIDDLNETHSNTPSQCINNLFMKTVAETSNSRSIREYFLENLSKTECYTLGATALDCSIMLTFQWIYDTNTNRYVHINEACCCLLIFIYICMIHVIMDWKYYEEAKKNRKRRSSRCCSLFKLF